MNETTKNPTNSKTEFGVDAHEPYKEQQPGTLGGLDNASNTPVEKPVPPIQKTVANRASRKKDTNGNVLDTPIGAQNSWVFNTSQATQRLGDSLFLKKDASGQGYVKARSALTNGLPEEEAITNFKLKQNGEKQKYTWPLEIGPKTNRQDIVSITYEEIGFFPRSFNRVFDRFLKQVFSDVENLVIQEYRFYRYLFLTTLKCMLILFFVPFFVNYLSKTYLVSPLTEYFWNTQQSEIFLNSYQQKRAFTELKDFEEKLYFESLINCGSKYNRFDDSSKIRKGHNYVNQEFDESSKQQEIKQNNTDAQTLQNVRPSAIIDEIGLPSTRSLEKPNFEKSTEKSKKDELSTSTLDKGYVNAQSALTGNPTQQTINRNLLGQNRENVAPALQTSPTPENNKSKTFVTWGDDVSTPTSPFSFESGTTTIRSLVNNSEKSVDTLRVQGLSTSDQNGTYSPKFRGVIAQSQTTLDGSFSGIENEPQQKVLGPLYFTTSKNNQIDGKIDAQSTLSSNNVINPTIDIIQKTNRQELFEQRLQEKTLELAFRYNNQSIEAITNFFADLISFITLCYLLIVLEIQVNITKSFLLEVFFGLDDGKKSLLILLITDLLVGYHSSNLWELFFEFLFNHYGLPESQTGIFLLVATLPVLLDVLFKYLIFRHLNRSSPATVATYHAIIE